MTDIADHDEACEQAASDALEFVMPKIKAIRDEKGLVGVWCNGFRLGWTAAPSSREGFDMLAHLTRQREWSGKTFGPGPRTAGVIDHIRKELCEIEADPSDITEWIDVVILALDGAWRAGFQPQQIIDAMVAKQTRNEGRSWPDWRSMPTDKAIEHDRSAEVDGNKPS